jgi:membrane-associated phospholipid phosphatase
MSRTRIWLFGLSLAAYLAIVIAVLTDSKLVTLDWQVMMFQPYKQWPQVHAFLDYFVVLGQRGPTAVVVAAWLGWLSWRRATWRPVLVLSTSLLLLNITVGAVKYGLGRLGPHYATTVGSAELFHPGGDIFPSGHTANAVVTWGVLAYLATTPGVRRVASVVAALLALGVGMTTIYLGTHWVSDVLLGWAAGLLILLALPWFEPAMARAENYLVDQWRRRRPAAAPAAGRSAVAGSSLGAAAALRGPRTAASEGETARPAGMAARGASSPAAGAGHHGTTAARAHGTRHERPPVTPAGSRRPAAERPVRPGVPLAQPRGRGATG